MAFVHLPPAGRVDARQVDAPADAPADARVEELYAADVAAQGFVSNYTRLFAGRPTVYIAWEQLKEAIKANMDPRRYELVTLVAARRLRSSYCALAHGRVLADQFYDSATVRRIAVDHHRAGLDARDVAIMDFADRVVADASSVTADDVAGLRAHGLSDAEIMDVALAAGVRCFFSKTIDAMGVRPDPAYRTLLEPELHQALTVGRPIEPDPTGREPAPAAADRP
jgi:uncharacterized peroxidase-related enzyme